MNLVKSFVCIALAVALAPGCSSVSKVKHTLALNDLHIQAAIAEEKGDDQTAYELWSNYVDRRPQSALAEYRLGMVESRLGKMNDAIGHLRVAHDLKPGNINYIEGLAGALAQINRIDGLMKLLRATIDEGQPGSGQLRLARYARRVGLMDEAKEALELAIIADRGQHVGPYLEMAEFARSINDQDNEIRYLRYALSFDPSEAAILSRLGELGMIPGPSLAIEPSY
jgi:tetratricopeptide (TPR) repeat protein